MPDSLTKTFGTGFDLATSDGRMNQYEYTPDAEAIYREGKLHEVAQLVYQRKTIKAINLTERIAQEAVLSASKFSAETFDLVEHVCRTPSQQAYFEAAVQPILSMFPELIRGIAQVGVTNIAQEQARNVVVKPPRKWFWEK